MERNSRPMKRGRKKVCMFCVDRAEKIDYKDIAKLRKCMTERGKILPRRVTGTCATTRESLLRLSRERVTLLCCLTLQTNCAINLF